MDTVGFNFPEREPIAVNGSTSLFIGREAMLGGATVCRTLGTLERAKVDPALEEE